MEENKIDKAIDTAKEKVAGSINEIKSSRYIRQTASNLPVIILKAIIVTLLIAAILSALFG